MFMTWQRRLAAATIALAAGAAWGAPPAQPPSLAAVAKKCKPGAAMQAEGIDTWGEAYDGGGHDMPKGVKGATTVSPEEAKCLIDQLGERLVVVQVMTDRDELPRAVAVRELGSADDSERTQQQLTERLAQLVGADKARPVLFYCHHRACHLSYNATVRATRAGYRSVFWLRSGNSGWKNAGLPLKDDLPGPSGFPVRYEKEVQACAPEKVFTLRDQYTLMFLHPTDAELARRFDERTEGVKRHQAECLGKLQQRHAGTPKIEADLRARLATGDTDAQAYMLRLRDEALANTAAYKTSLDQLDIAATLRVVDAARAYQSVAQRCGTVPGYLPSNNDQIEQARRHVRSQETCLKALAVDFNRDEEAEFDAAAFEAATRSMAGLSRYVCSRRPVANCLPDESLRRVTAVINADNLRVVQRAASLQKQRKADVERAYDEISAYVQRVNARTAAHNERVEQRNSRAYGGGYSGGYSMPEPPPVTIRRDSSTSAPGMR